MDGKAIGELVSVSRMGFGAGLILAPPRFARSWTGPGASQRPARVVARSLGARELALGAGGLLATVAGGPGERRRWFALGALTEAADVLVTLTDGPRTPARLTGAAMAAATAAAAAYAALSDGR
jgi:hypothetical protein